jgi:Tol biopolymer transport system component
MTLRRGLAGMRYTRYNVLLRRPLPLGPITLAAVAVGLVTLTPAHGGVFAGDNGLIAYTCGANICKANSDGSGKVTLVTGASDPSWSSDASSIAYVDGTAQIVVADADGTHPAVISAGPAAQPSFSFDGNRVAYVRSGDIYSSLSNTGGAELHLTNTPTAVDADPAYSPNGTKIAFASNVSSGGYHIWTMNADGTGTPQQITSAGGGERSPTWSPSGQTIVYSVAGELWAVGSAGGGATDLHVAGTDPAYSPDGHEISFITPSGGVSKMVAQANGAVTILDTSTGNLQPDWQATSPVNQPPSSSTGPPVNVAYPTVNLAFGDTAPTVGNFLTASVGTWNGAFPLTYTYQWKRCDAADPLNGSCFDIAGARSSFYTPVTADYGARLRVQVTATNAQGSASQNSDVTAVVTAIAPKLRVTPPITGRNVVDQILSLGFATWDGTPAPTFAYSWRRCNPAGDFASCVQIPGATQSTYTPAVADIGFTIRVWITGTNPAGVDIGITNHTFPIVDKQHFSPSAVVAPTITGTIAAGRQLTGSIGTFNGDSPIATTFVWQRCDATGAACRSIPGATKVVYHPTANDLSATLRLVVTAKNAYGTLISMSDPSDPVLAAPPHRRGRHIVGTRRGDYLAGGGFDDVILGMGGNDTLLGGAGDDRLDGGPGNDVLTGGPGADRILGGPGSDTIYAADGERDIIDCGDGADRAIVDSVDIVKNCEVVQKATTPTTPSLTPTPTPSQTP